jgi:two-component system sensor histidine kinase DesK
VNGLLWSGADEPYPTPRHEISRRRIRGFLFSILWLWPLWTIFDSIFSGRTPLPWLAGAGLTVFVALYLTSIMLGFSRQAPEPSLRDQLFLFATTALGVALILGWSADPDWFGLTIFIAAAGASIYRTRRAVAWMLAVLLFQGAVIRWRGHPWSQVGDLAFATVLAGGLVLIVRQAIALIRELRQTRQALAKSAVEQERLRFARDLHDLLGHSLSAIVVKAEVVRRIAERDPAAAAREAGEIETIGRTALSEVRLAVSGYRARSFADELTNAKDALADAGIEAVVKTTDKPLPSEVDDAFGWVVREAATNVVRHSGASVCVIALTRTKEWVLEIRDDGRGGEMAPGNGLRGVMERMNAIGGTVEVKAHEGFTLKVTAP